MIDTISIKDYTLPPDFVNHCRNSTLPVAIVGNGGSLKELTSDDFHQINSSRVMRCNWSFQDTSPIKKEYMIYFSQAYGSGKEPELASLLDECIDRGDVKVFRSCTYIIPGTKDVELYVTPDSRPVWPTTGIQMLYYASFAIPTPEIIIGGMDMYTYKRPSRHLSKEEGLKYLQSAGKPFGNSPKDSIGSTFLKANLCMAGHEVWTDAIRTHKLSLHFMEIDMLILLECFGQLILTDTKVTILKNPILTDIYNIARDNIELIQQYFDHTPGFIHSINSQKPSYCMWRLINNMQDKLLPD